MANPTDVFNQQISGLLWQLGFTTLKWVLLAIGVVLVFGFIAGIFTYGRPLRPVKRRHQSDFEEALDGAWFIGMSLMHRLIDRLRGIHSQRNTAHAWLTDQQILKELRALTPKGFEEIVAQLFAAMGYHATVLGGKNDGGVDVELWKNKKLSLVQCKKYITQRVVPHDVRDFFGAMGDMRADHGFFVTTGFFTFDAERFAEDKPIDCIDGLHLARMMREYGVVGGEKDMDPDGACPKCGHPLVMRTNKKDGTTFMGCSGYPNCRYTQSSRQ